MGHDRLHQLPTTRNWRKVIGTLRATDDPAVIADRTTQAADRGINLAKEDRGGSRRDFSTYECNLVFPRKEFSGTAWGPWRISANKVRFAGSCAISADGIQGYG